MAIAGLVASAGSAVGAAVAYAQPVSFDSPAGADATTADSSRDATASARRVADAAAPAGATDGAPAEDSATRPTQTEPDGLFKTPATGRRDTSCDPESFEAIDVSPAVGPASPVAADAVGRSGRTTDVAWPNSDPGSQTRGDGIPGSSDQTVTAEGDLPSGVVPATAGESTIPATDLVATAGRLATAPTQQSVVAMTTAPDPQLVDPAPIAPAPGPSPLPLIPVAALSASSATGSSNTRSRSASAVDSVSLLPDAAPQHVLLLGVDGTNLSRVLADPNNANFFALMDTGTTAAASIAGHMTVSNPSWTTVFTGVWDTKHGVINNVFTPDTYSSWPTLFNQLEAFDPAIQTKAIADWDVVADIAGAGARPADEVVYISRLAGDADWSQTDSAVTAEAIRSILGTDPGYEDVPNFLFTFLLQVDENGHSFGGASPEYAAAIRRTDTNVGLIMAAVAEREAATGEDWTVLMVTDHGHTPQKSLTGHGFQSPDETSTFVIADGPAFGDGKVNPQYQIVDTTPTVLSLFGAAQPGYFDGVPLMTLGGSDVDPVDLHQALDAAIAVYGYPDIRTHVALDVRMVFASLAYGVYYLTDIVSDQLQGIVNQDIFLVSPSAWLTDLYVRIVFGDIVYGATNILAQYVARLTGAGVVPPPPEAAVAEPASR